LHSPVSVERTTGSIDGNHYETVIIGAGMSGLAAGIRLAYFGKNVLILERHNAAGGLNSFYSFQGRKYDVGLHAMTNFVRSGTKGTPLGKVLRQLRLERESFDLSEQKGSRIIFPGVELQFNNDFELFESEVIRAFPHEKDNFAKLIELIRSFNEVALDNEETSARVEIAKIIKDPLLIDMILLPLMYYGSAQENDMDFSQFVVMFKSLFFEGFARPFEGVRQIIRVLLKRYKELGGQRKMKCGVKQIILDKDQVKALELDNGDTITADKVISSAGLVETLRMCSDHPTTTGNDNIGRISCMETTTVLNKEPSEFGWEDTILFFSDQAKAEYACPKNLVDPRSGVVCLPNNYQYGEGRTLEEGFLRITALANFDKWTQLPEEEYQASKKEWHQVLLDKALHLLGTKTIQDVQPHVITTDIFTPRTIKKYTGHLAGALYGAPHKTRDGRTPIKDLFICGTDQGFLGIVGAMLSGISMANLHILQPSS